MVMNLSDRHAIARNGSRGAIVLAVLAATAIPTTGSTQEEGPGDTSSVEAPEDRAEGDEEETDEAVGEEKPRLRSSFFLTSEVHSMNNLDLRARDESTDQDILETDDRNTFAYTGLAAELEYDVLEDTQFDFAAAHSGLWGNDQLGGVSGARSENETSNQEISELANRGSHFIWLYRLSVTWRALETSTLDVATTVGRQRYEIGGVDDDYFFDDTIDGITVELDAGEAGTLNLLPFDFYASNASPDDADFVDYSARNPTIAGFRGDTNTLRFGGVYENRELVDGLDLRAFGFYADIGASTRSVSTGADRTRAGKLGNFSDQDYTWMTGLRAAYDYEFGAASVGAFGEFARSGGLDRKDTEVGLEDVQNQGNAYGGGLRGDVDLAPLKIDWLIRGFHADGGRYSSESGVQFSHGFVSFKGDEVGGLNLDRYMGFHPSAYVSPNGISDHPNDIDRKSGTRFGQVGLGFDIADKLRAELDGWYLFDTSESLFDQDEIGETSSDLPFGYTEADLRAQERFGKPIGAEANASLSYRANTALRFYAKGGMFFPSEYYEIEIDRAASQGTKPALGSDDPQNFWALLAGTSLRF